MNYHVMEARYVGGYAVWLRFRDGTSGEIDLHSVLEGPVFAPLQDPQVFHLRRGDDDGERAHGPPPSKGEVTANPALSGAAT